MLFYLKNKKVANNLMSYNLRTIARQTKFAYSIIFKALKIMLYNLNLYFCKKKELKEKFVFPRAFDTCRIPLRLECKVSLAELTFEYQNKKGPSKALILTWYPIL